jgi:hypothetical protein
MLYSAPDKLKRRTIWSAESQMSKVILLGIYMPESTQKNLLATKGMKTQEFFWMKNPNMD